MTLENVDVEAAIRSADPLVLRAALWIQTRSDELEAMATHRPDAKPGLSVAPLALRRDDDAARVRSEALDLFRSLASGERQVRRPGPDDVPTIVEMLTGVRPDDETFEFWREEFPIVEHARRPDPIEPQALSDTFPDLHVVIIGSGMGGISSAVMLQIRGYPVHDPGEELRSRRHVVFEQLPRPAGRSAESGLLLHVRTGPPLAALLRPQGRAARVPGTHRGHPWSARSDRVRHRSHLADVGRRSDALDDRDACCRRHGRSGRRELRLQRGRPLRSAPARRHRRARRLRRRCDAHQRMGSHGRTHGQADRRGRHRLQRRPGRAGTGRLRQPSHHLPTHGQLDRQAARLHRPDPRRGVVADRQLPVVRQLCPDPPDLLDRRLRGSRGDPRRRPGLGRSRLGQPTERCDPCGVAGVHPRATRRPPRPDRALHTDPPAADQAAPDGQRVVRLVAA